MHSSTILLPAFAALAFAQNSTTTPATPGSIFLGQQCNPSDESPCVYGAVCYGVSSMTIPTCGSFQATWTDNSQCATNECNNGFCNGVPKNGSTPVGSPCSPTIPGQCALGSNCYATNSMLTPRCGNFQSTCTTDAQCAYNTCNNGLCNGFLSTTSGTSTATGTVTSTQSSSLSTATRAPTSTSTGGFSNSTTTRASTSSQASQSSYTTIITNGGRTTTSVVVTTPTSGSGNGAPVSPSTTPSIISNSGARVMNGAGAAFAAAVGFAFFL